MRTRSYAVALKAYTHTHKHSNQTTTREKKIVYRIMSNKHAGWSTLNSIFFSLALSLIRTHNHLDGVDAGLLTIHTTSRTCNCSLLMSMSKLDHSSKSHTQVSSLFSFVIYRFSTSTSLSWLSFFLFFFWCCFGVRLFFALCTHTVRAVFSHRRPRCLATRHLFI